MIVSASNSTSVALCQRPGAGFAAPTAWSMKMHAALQLWDCIPKWVVYLIMLIVPGGLLIAPLIAVRMHRYRRAVASQAV